MSKVSQIFLDQDIKTKRGATLIQKGLELTFPVIFKIRNYSREIDIVEHIFVKIINK